MLKTALSMGPLQCQWPQNEMWHHVFSRIFLPLGWCNDGLRQLFSDYSLQMLLPKKPMNDLMFTKVFQVKVIFKVAKVLSPALLIRRFWGYIVLTSFARISHGKDLLELGKLSFNEQFSVLQVPGRFSEDSMGCSISGVKRRCQWNLLDVWSHTQKKTANKMKLVHRLEFPSIILGAMWV